MNLSVNSLLMIGIALGLVALAYPRRSGAVKFLEAEMASRNKGELGTRQALDMRHLVKEPLWRRVKAYLDDLQAQVGSHLLLKSLAVLAAAVVVTRVVRTIVPDWPVLLLFLLVLVVMLVLALRLLQVLEQRMFASSFPDALNLLSSAVSSGESLMQAIIFVGETLESGVGREFKLMGQRLSLGHDPDEVFRLACRRYPYPAFYFFALTLRANLNRGGQLREMLHRLNRVMFNSRAMDKKKSSMTSEARASAKIVAAIPFAFLLMMKYMMPENFAFVMYEPAGRPLLYYVLISEALGLGIIWALMKKVRV